MEINQENKIYRGWDSKEKSLSGILAEAKSEAKTILESDLGKRWESMGEQLERYAFEKVLNKYVKDNDFLENSSSILYRFANKDYLNLLKDNGPHGHHGSACQTLYFFNKYYFMKDRGKEYFVLDPAFVFYRSQDRDSLTWHEYQERETDRLLFNSVQFNDYLADESNERFDIYRGKESLLDFFESQDIFACLKGTIKIDFNIEHIQGMRDKKIKFFKEGLE